ncbi:MAG: sulfurtransferase [Gammaproteobacteria bacterium]|nr:MAG: sulfurtransferase [Gammaproteobacteria bacterium]
MKRAAVTAMVWGTLSWAGMVQAVQVPGPLIATDWLASHQADVVILDVRRETESFTAAPKFMKDRNTGKQRLVCTGGHIPGAALVDYNQVRARREVNGQIIMHLLPARADFEKLMQQSGVNRDSTIVIASRGQDIVDLAMATRLYWTLKYYGHDNMGILDGGMAQWLADGRNFTTRSEKPATGNWRAGEGRIGILATTNEVTAATKTGSSRLVDNRAISLYLGTWKTSNVYDKGHIPGAGSFPGELMNSAGMPSRFLPVDELRQLFQAMDIDMDAGTITYCDSGHLASGGWFIMSELLGNRNVRLYDGSMHEWTLNRLPVQRFDME